MDSNSAVGSEEQERRNWVELPPELWSTILLKLDIVQILTAARSVCSSWREICNEPSMWRVIDFRGLVDTNRDFERVCRHAVHLSCGQLVDINIQSFATNHLLEYIARRSSQLKRLGIVKCYKITDSGFIKAVSKLPLLEHLELDNCSFNVKTLKTVGRFCPFLKSFKLKKMVWVWAKPGIETYNDDAFAIVETMPKLQHLQIIDNLLTNEGLQAILDRCSDLESLDVRGCLNLDLYGQFGQKCVQRIKTIVTGFYFNDWESGFRYDPEPLWRHAIDLSYGQLVDINIVHFDTLLILVMVSWLISTLCTLTPMNFSNALLGETIMGSEGQKRNWLDLPSELWSMILHKIGAVQILTTAQYVCSSWHKICTNPQMWRIINTQNNSRNYYKGRHLRALCMHAIDLSCGQLDYINIHNFGNDRLLQYITSSSVQLRGLRIEDCDKISDDGFMEAISKLPLLEHLELFGSTFYIKTLKTIGKFCPLLNSLKLNQFVWDGDCDDDALVIAETMPNLHHLQIYGNSVTNKGLKAILKGCPDLESLDLRQCLDLDMNGLLGQQCAQKIKNLHLPHDSLNGYRFSTIFGDCSGSGYIGDSSLSTTDEDDYGCEDDDYDSMFINVHNKS